MKVIKTVPGGPAEAAGLKPDDIFVSLDGMEIEDAKTLAEAIGEKAVGAEIKLAILRDKREKRLAVMLAARPAEFAAAKPVRDGPLPQLDTGGHMALMRSIAFTADAKFIVSASEDVVNGLAFSHDSKKLISGSADKSAIIWDLETQTLLRRLEGHSDAIYPVGFTPDGKRAVTGSFDNTLRLWNVADGAMISVMAGHGAKVRSVRAQRHDRQRRPCRDHFVVGW